MMFNRVKETILSFNMFSKGDSVLIALSGGPDSMALLYLLKRIALRYKLKLFIAHLNHGLRGKEAIRDQKFCKDLGKKLNIPVFTANVNIGELRKEIKGSIEDLARKERYRFLEKISQRLGVSKIALGHTADDQVETVIMRLLRGAGTKGLSGINPKRKLEGSDIWVIRPLIGVWRKEILRYLKKEKISYVEDSTNKELNFLRNRIRHELLPLLSEYNPNIKTIIQSTGNNIAVVNDYLQEITESVFRKITDITKEGIGVNRDKLNNYHPAISQMLVRRIVGEVNSGVQLDADNVKRVLALAGSSSGSKSINLPKGVWIRREYNKLVFSRINRGGNGNYAKKLVINGETPIRRPNILVISKICKGDGSFSSLSKTNISGKSSIFEKKGLSFEAELDYDTLTHPVVVRNRQPGDVFYPIGMKGSKKIKDIFIDEKVPRVYRDRVPILASGNQIYWIVGYRIGEKFKVRSDTKRILKIKVEI